MRLDGTGCAGLQAARVDVFADPLRRMAPALGFSPGNRRSFRRMSSAVRSGVFGDPVAYQGCTSSWLGADEALVVRALYSGPGMVRP